MFNWIKQLKMDVDIYTAILLMVWSWMDRNNKYFKRD